MSTLSTDVLEAISSGRQHSYPVHGNWRGSVVKTFRSYQRYNVNSFPDIDSSLWPYERFPNGHMCYAYLFLAHSNQQSRLFKVGITRNLRQRFSQFVNGLPPYFKSQPLSAHLFGCEAWAEKCEVSVLAACSHLWIGGEWLAETIDEEATDGR